jgi:hypothetical protein
MNHENKVDAIVRIEHATVALSSLADEVLIPATIAKAEYAVIATGECLAQPTLAAPVLAWTGAAVSPS